MTEIQSSTENPGQRTRKHYLPLADVQPGMVLGEPVTVVERNTLRFRMPADYALTEDNLRQLAAYHVEFICVRLPDERSDEQIAADIATTTAQVKTIFAGADLSNPVMAALFDRVLAYRSS